MTAGNEMRVYDLPSVGDITLSGESLELSRDMSDQEARALLIQTYRYAQEMAGFIRSLQAAMQNMSESGGMAGLMARQFMGGM